MTERIEVGALHVSDFGSTELVEGRIPNSDFNALPFVILKRHGIRFNLNI